MHLPTQEWLHTLETHALTGVTNFHINDQIMYTNIHRDANATCRALQMLFMEFHTRARLFFPLCSPTMSGKNICQSSEEPRGGFISPVLQIQWHFYSRQTRHRMLRSGRQFLSSFLQMFSPLTGYCLRGCQRKPRWFLRRSQCTKGLRDGIIHAGVQGGDRVNASSHIVLVFLGYQSWHEGIKVSWGRWPMWGVHLGKIQKGKFADDNAAYVNIHWSRVGFGCRPTRGETEWAIS